MVLTSVGTEGAFIFGCTANDPIADVNIRFRTGKAAIVRVRSGLGEHFEGSPESSPLPRSRKSATSIARAIEKLTLKVHNGASVCFNA